MGFGLDIKAYSATVLGGKGWGRLGGGRLEPGLLKGISVSQGEERGCGTNTCYVVNRVPENHGNHTQHGLTQCMLVPAGGGYGGKKALSNEQASAN